MTDAIDDHVSEAFDRLLATYGEPKTENIAGFEAEFRDALETVPPKILRAAVTTWIRRDTPFWPRPGEVLAECRRLLDDPRYRKSVPANVNADPRPSQTPEQLESVRKMVRDAIAFLSDPRTAVDDAKVDCVSAQRPAFEAMQRDSANTMHRSRMLTPLTKRMTGEHRE